MESSVNESNQSPFAQTFSRVTKTFGMISMKPIHLLVIFSALFSCEQQGKSELKNEAIRQEKLEQITYYIKDTSSTLWISYQECTECLDAWVDSGKVYLPDSVFKKINMIHAAKGNGFIPNARDLYLTGQDKIKEILFGDSSNYGEHWHDKFVITGKAIDVSGSGIVFRVDHYEKIKIK